MKPDKVRLEVAGFSEISIGETEMTLVPPDSVDRHTVLFDANGHMQLFEKRSTVHRKIKDAHA